MYIGKTNYIIKEKGKNDAWVGLAGLNYREKQKLQKIVEVML